MSGTRDEDEAMGDKDCAHFIEEWMDGYVLYDRRLDYPLWKMDRDMKCGEPQKTGLLALEDKKDESRKTGLPASS